MGTVSPQLPESWLRRERASAISRVATACLTYYDQLVFWGDHKMRLASKLLAATVALAIAGAASAQMQLVHRVGDRWVFALPDPTLVEARYIGEKVYFPITGARRIGTLIRIGNAAVCNGRYSGSVSAGLGSVEGRVVRLAPSEADFENNRGEVNRRSTAVFVLSNCKFGPADIYAVPKEMLDDDAAREAREIDASDRQVQEFIRYCEDVRAGRVRPTPEQEARNSCDLGPRRGENDEVSPDTVIDGRRLGGEWRAPSARPSRPTPPKPLKVLRGVLDVLAPR